MTRLITLILLSATLWTASRADAIMPVPQPAEYTAAPGSYRLPSTLTVAPAGNDAAKMAKTASDYLKMRGVKARTGKFAAADVKVTADPSLGAEAYRLDVTPGGITIAASGDAGVFYAVQTLVQITDSDGTAECCSVSDTPRFGYRGLMIDPCRYFVPFDELKKLVDMASRLKINTLHLHLTDDNGWRLEIKRYPRLTEVGAWRVERNELFHARPNPQRDEPTPVGGYYTQAQMRELVSYASKRHITVIPEIDMPAHSVAAIASYPELRCQVDDHRFVGVLPGIGGSHSQVICCAGNDNTFRFFENVLDEVMAIFPSQHIHIGGDEANKTMWRQCPLCNKRMADEGLTDYEQLQGYFMNRINSYLRSRGRKAIGWDEVTYGHPEEDITVLGWQGTGHTAVNYARETGREFILSPARILYLIRYQGPQWFEPFTYFGNNTLADVYNYEPVGEDWSPALESQLKGIQASMWTEFITDESNLEYMLFPRLIALADAAWRPKGSGNWKEFLRSLDRFLPVLDRCHINYARSMYNLDHIVRPDGCGGLKAHIGCIRPDVDVCVSTSPDFADSRQLTDTISLSSATTIHAATFRDGIMTGMPLTLDIGFNKATGHNAEILNGSGNHHVLTNGVRGSMRNSDFEWAGVHNRTAEITLD
ncbi:MAG: beta-N-acetylhexosaminidase, partial [Muribaculaceae bacterium]|nr:beta-N-acetylhexosaminidase [Muribaculaceae bacterium]